MTEPPELRERGERERERERESYLLHTITINTYIERVGLV